MPAGGLRRPDERLIALVVLAIGSIIAALRPFDAGFDLVTHGAAILRALLLPALGLAGLLCARRAGLLLVPRTVRHALRRPLAVALGAAVAVALIDGFVFRAILPADYVASMTAVSKADRLLYFMLRAFNEEILYRLFLMSLLAWGFGLIWRDEGNRPATGAYWAAIVMAQVVNIAMNVPLPATPILCLYDIVRYICPGVVWGYLYWRHGFTSAALAHVATHAFLQPVLGLLLA